jgi:hypothetical protein
MPPRWVPAYAGLNANTANEVGFPVFDDAEMNPVAAGSLKV